MNKVFIAGGTGMLGANTAREFADAGVDVVVSSRKASDPVGQLLEDYSSRIRIEQLDLRDAEAVKQTFETHHFDGLVFVAHTHQYALRRETVNEIYPILLNCLENARKTQVKRVVFGSSMAVYGGLTPPFDETVTFPPGITEPPGADRGVMKKFEVSVKRAIEIIALDYGQPFQMGLSVPPGTVNPDPFDMEVVALRSPMMFGPGYRALGSALGIAAHVAAGRLEHFKGQPAYGDIPVETLWQGLSSIPVNYVKDNATAIRVAMFADVLPGPVYNISSGFSRSPREQLQALLNVAPDCADRMQIKPDDLPIAEMDLGFDGRRFEQDFGWSSPFTLESALSDYIGWLKTHSY
ncbi:MAG: NAD(P)-dependent oxidoreductase [Pseudomonadota bacterium]